jgi:hypothetical protein
MKGWASLDPQRRLSAARIGTLGSAGRNTLPAAVGALAALKTIIPISLPKKLPGVVRPQWVRCGRPNCRCASDQLHGPYWYRFWRENGKLKKQYVRPADLEQVQARCEARRQARRDLQDGWRVWRQLLAGVREVEREADGGDGNPD